MHLLAHLEIGGRADADGLQLCQLLLGRQQLQHCNVLVWIAANELQQPHTAKAGLSHGASKQSTAFHVQTLNQDLLFMDLQQQHCNVLLRLSAIACKSHHGDSVATHSQNECLQITVN